jgi:hypothetical protein
VKTKDVLSASAERSVKVAGSGVQEDIPMLLRLFKDKLLDDLREGDVPGLMAATFIVRGGQELGPGMAMCLQDRLILGWQKGIFRKPVLATVPLSGITGAQSGTKAKTGRMAKPLASLTVAAGEQWELLFTQDAPDLELRDTLSQLLDGTLTLAQLPEYVEHVDPGRE